MWYQKMPRKGQHRDVVRRLREKPHKNMFKQESNLSIVPKEDDQRVRQGNSFVALLKYAVTM